MLRLNLNQSNILLPLPYAHYQQSNVGGFYAIDLVFVLGTGLVERI